MAQNNQQHFIPPQAPMHPVHYQRQHQQQASQPGEYQLQPFPAFNQPTYAQQPLFDYATPRQMPFTGGTPQQYVQHLHRGQQLRDAAYAAHQAQQQQAQALQAFQAAASAQPAPSPAPAPVQHPQQHIGKHPPSYSLQPRPIASSAQDIDLNSAAAKTPNFSFVKPELHHTAIHILPCLRPVSTCFEIKRWMVGQFANNSFGLPGILRIEGQNLDSLDKGKAGTLVLLEDAAHLDGEPRYPVTIMAVLVKGDAGVRWFYNLLPPHTMLNALAQTGVITTKGTVVDCGTEKHRRLFVYLRETFLKAVTIPEHPDYLAAQQMTDYCPDMLDPDTAYDRLEGNETLYFANNGNSEPLDLADDRYTHELHPAESSIASDLKLRCSAYLLLKRRFFHHFWREIVQFKEKIGVGRSRVRSEHAHEVWLVESSDVTGVKLKSSKAKRLVIAWRILGFLDERKFLPWLKAGGMLEEVAEQVEEEEVEVKKERGDGRAGRRK
ncbi:hypothetical protein LTR85_002574 [Meristemomyces frigidus]|nr:hypothetical protein LTR85_002574 [Meristemomyces frigidus]